MSRSLAKSRKAMATKSLKEKWLSIVQLMREKGENETGGSSIITGERGKIVVGGVIMIDAWESIELSEPDSSSSCKFLNCTSIVLSSNCCIASSSKTLVDV